MNDITHSSSKIFISSANTSNWVKSDSNTHMLVPITPFILANGDPNHFVIGLESASIPLSIYTVNATNNILVINSYTFNIQHGNYTIINLINYLNLYADLVWTNVGKFVFSYDTINNRISIVSTDTPTNIIIGTNTTCEKILGVLIGTYSTLTYISQNQVNLTYTTGILVAINNISTSNRDNNISGAGGASILARIPINCPLYRILSFYNPQPFYTTISNRVISQIDIQLLNDDYTPLVLEGNPNIFITLRVDYAEKSKPVIEKTELQKARDIKNISIPISTQIKRQDLTTRANKKI